MDNPFDQFDQTQQAAPVEQGSAPAVASNPFDQFDENKAPAAQQQAPSTAEQKYPDQGAFMAGVEGFNRTFGSAAEGVIDGVSRILGYTEYNKQVQNYTAQMNESDAQASKNHPYAHGAGTVAGIASQAAIPLGAAAKGASLVNRAVTGAGTAAMYNFAATPGDFDTRMNSAGVGALVGGTVGAVAQPVINGIGYLGGKMVQGAKNLKNTITGQPVEGSSGFLGKLFDPEASALRDVAEEARAVGGIQNIQKRTAPFEGLGIVPTAEEGIGSPILSDMVKNLDRSPKTARLIEQTQAPRAAQIMGVAKEQIDQFAPKGINSQKASNNVNYEALKEFTVPDEVMASINSNPVLSKRIDLLNKNSSPELSKLPNNSMYKLNEQKKNIDSELWNNSPMMSDNSKAVSATKKDALLDARKTLVEAMDNTLPEYAKIRKQAEATAYYNNFSELLSKKPYTAGKLTPEVSETNPLAGRPMSTIYDTLWNTPEKQKYFVEAVDSVGGDPKAAQKIIQVMNMTKNTSVEAIHDKAGTTGGKVQYNGLGNAVLTAVHNLKRGVYDKSLLELVLNPKWKDIVSEEVAKRDAAFSMVDAAKLLEKTVNAKPRGGNAGLLSGAAVQNQQKPNGLLAPQTQEQQQKQ